MHHDLDAVAAAAEVAMADELILRDATAFMSRSLPRLPVGATRRLRRLQPAAEEQLSDARIGKDLLRAILHARAAELEDVP